MKFAQPFIGAGLALASLAAARGNSPLSHDTLSLAAQQPFLSGNVVKHKLTTDLVGLHKSLVDIESISGNEGEVGKWLADSLESQGYHVELQEVDNDRYNVLAWLGNNRNGRLLITSHIDTVPPYIPYKAVTNESGTYISGRGSVDAKGSVASMIVAANELVNSIEITPDDYTLLFVIDEETGGRGMRAANDLGLTPTHVIFGEPTDKHLASGHKGILHLDLKAFGKAAHSGYPWLGRSANEVLVKAMAALIELGEKLPKSKEFGVTTINLGTIQGGVAANVVSESASAKVAVRIAKGTPEDIEKAMTKAIEDAVADMKTHKDDKLVELDFGSGGYGPVPLDSDVPGFESMVVNYGTDVPNLNYTVEGQKRYLYGPGTIFVAHSDHEALTLDELEGAVEGYKKLILHCLQT